MAKAVKLADIAELVGVSTVTVSKALSGQKGVSEELRGKIKKLADEMGYKQPSAVRRRPPNKSYNIGILIAEPFLSKYESFYWQMYQAVVTKASLKECFALLEVVSARDEEKGSLPKCVADRKVDGVIVIGAMMHSYLNNLNENGGVPVIYMDFYDEKEASDTVIPNSFYGAYTLTNYLFSMGHRKIAYVGTLLATSSITDRYFGYSKAMLEHGAELKPEWIIQDRSLETGKLDVGRMERLPKDMPTAFVCNSDLTASYLIKILNEGGYRVPEDISVVGFDNYLYPGLCEIGITTYEVDIKEMARKVVQNIVKKMENDNYKPGMYIVEGHLVYKDSVRHV